MVHAKDKEGTLRATAHRQTATLISNRYESNCSRLLSFELSKAIHYAPGQIAQLTLSNGLNAYFAIASHPKNQSKLSFLIQESDDPVAKGLLDLQVQEKLTICAPLGQGFELEPQGQVPKELLLIGMGSAIGALRSALLASLDAPHLPRPKLIVALKSEADLAFTSELKDWHDLGVATHLVLSRKASPSGPYFKSYFGHIQEWLPTLIEDPQAALALLAGSETFEEDISLALLENGLSPYAIQKNFRPDERASCPLL